MKEETGILLELTTEEDSDLPIFLAGNFNQWQANNEAYQLIKLATGKYRFKFKSKTGLPDPIEYKYVRGSWDLEEVDEHGHHVGNRKAHLKRSLIKDHVARWKNKNFRSHSRYYPQIKLISESFEIPQLIKTRRIAALLPHNYGQTQKKYPVLYLQDGQNLLDKNAPFGSWEVDKELSLMAEKGMGDIIIIAIDHAEKERIEEFTPSYNTRLGSGDGKKYVRFLADTLKPYIDKHFRTLTGREHTGIGGSSMGGLISIYAAFMYPEVYSKILVFSPSLWVAPNIHSRAINFEPSHNTKLYLYGGGEESENMIPNLKRFKTALEQSETPSGIETKLSIDQKGQHNEAHWGHEFPKAVEWLFFRNNSQNAH